MIDYYGELCTKIYESDKSIAYGVHLISSNMWIINRCDYPL